MQHWFAKGLEYTCMFTWKISIEDLILTCVSLRRNLHMSWAELSLISVLNSCFASSSINNVTLYRLQTVQNQFMHKTTGVLWYLRNANLHLALKLPTTTLFLKQASKNISTLQLVICSKHNWIVWFKVE